MEQEMTPQEALPKMRALLEEGLSFRLTVTGTSMVPFLRHKKDAVILSPWDETAAAGDIFFYVTPSGRPLLHRYHKTTPEGDFILCGDHQSNLELVKPEWVWGKVSQIERNGKRFSAGHWLWRLLSRAWIGLYPVRPRLVKMMQWAYRFKCGSFGRK